MAAIQANGGKPPATEPLKPLLKNTGNGVYILDDQPVAKKKKES